MAVNWHELIPGLKEFDEHNEIKTADPAVWPCMEGNVGLAISYTAIFWPDFFELDGMVFRYELTKARLDSWLRHTKGNKKSVEWVVNHIHIQDIHGMGSTATPEQLIYLGRALKDMLICKLLRDFPDKQFVVEFIEDNIENLADYQVSFFQEHGTE